MMEMLFQDTYDFTLPHGFADAKGGRIRSGSMRLATAGDELSAARDPRVRANPESITLVVLSKVIVQLEDGQPVTPEMLENLPVQDFNFLQNMYQTINESEAPMIRVTCPHCGKEFSDPINFSQME